MGDLHLQMPVTWHCCSRSTSSYVKHPADVVLVPLAAAKSHTCAVLWELFQACSGAGFGFACTECISQ